jgi:hypothetical protein
LKNRLDSRNSCLLLWNKVVFKDLALWANCLSTLQAVYHKFRWVSFYGRFFSQLGVNGVERLWEDPALDRWIGKAYSVNGVKELFLVSLIYFDELRVQLLLLWTFIFFLIQNDSDLLIVKAD